jgi:hypothetical protein
VPTYDEDSQKTGRVMIYFDVEGKQLGTATAEGEAQECSLN